MGIKSGKKYSSAKRRLKRTMCMDCLHAQHATCDKTDCPCVCNDKGFSKMKEIVRIIHRDKQGISVSQFLQEVHDFGRERTA